MGIRSHPMWVRGLKYQHRLDHDRDLAVAPHVGAWIEMQTRTLAFLAGCGSHCSCSAAEWERSPVTSGL